MIILTTTASNQTLKVIPREYASNFSLSVRDDSTNVTKVYEITNATTVGNYLNVTLAFNPVLVENHFYDLTYYSDPNFWNTNYFLWNAETGYVVLRHYHLVQFVQFMLMKLEWTIDELVVKS